ncbi:S-layer homology domain-containing protein [Intestinimonas butyriciproducens]|uniref:S-layer homology domain-containing protein n=1 Tax=Intestinimonas butyriciproducens TaxID=1297617 RepID=UPI0018CD2208|nr:S-layer homology domain-containing protein [Intestinimonas butyriciproducens]
MLLTGPMGVLEAYAEDSTPSAVESVDSETQDGGVSSSTLEDSHSSGSATPSDMSLGTSSVQDSGAPIQQRSTGGPTQLAASVTATVTATVGYNTVSVNLTGSESFADASVVEVADNTTWLIEDSNLEEVEIISVSRQSDKNVRLTLLNLLQPGTYTLFAAAAVFNPEAGGTQEFNVTVHTPVPAVGTAAATAGEKTIAVNLTQGGFADSSNKGNWTLGGTSAGGNPIHAVAYQNGSNVTITLTNLIDASDNYTLQAEPGAFANIMTMPFAAPLNVTISGGATAPAFAEGYPKAGSMQMAGSRQVSVVISAQEAAYYDFVLLSDGADAPSAEQVRDGKAADGQPALKAYSGKTKLTADTGLSTSSFTPEHDTAYDLYVILRDDEGNLSTPVKVDVKSPPAADFLSATYPKVGDTQPNGSKQVQIQVQVQGTGQEGKVYWVLLPDGADAPTIDEVGAGTANGGGAPISSGSPEFAKDTLSTFLVTGAQDATAYDLYLVVGDTENYNPLAECTDVVKLDVTTPAVGASAFEVSGTQYTTLSGALGAVGNNGTIKLLRTVNTTEQIVLLNKTITLDLGSFDLNISSPANEGIKVTEGTLNITGNGKLDATGRLYGVWANNGTVTVDDAQSSTDGIGVYAKGGANITVRGNAAGQDNGVYATNIYTTVTVKGNVTSTTGQVQGAVYALNQAEVIVEGDVSADSGDGVHTYNSGVITVEGDVYGLRAGALTEGTGGSITVKGDLSSYNHCAVITNGSSGNITVDGTVTPKNAASYVLINNVRLEKDTGVSDPGKSGYLKYSGSGAAGVVWVKDSTAAKVCEIAGGPQHTSLAEALGDVTNGQTIRLLQNITHTAVVEINGMGITFDLNGFDLTIDTSAINGSTALFVTGGGVVSYTGAGKFSAIGNSTAVRANGTGSKLTVGYAETTRGSAYTVQATDGGTVTVKGNVLAKEAGTNALDAYGGGKITVQGNVTCAGHNSTGALATGQDSTIHVTGDITATAAGTGSTGVNVKSDGAATIIGDIAASQIGITTSGLGNAGTVIVTGNVSTTGTATGAADREGIGAGGGGSVTVNGNVSAAGENCTGIYANGSAVIVTGSVTSENTGVVSTGDMTWRGRVFIDGELTAGTPYIRVGSTSKTAVEDTKPSDQVGYLKYTDGIHSVYVKEAPGIILVSNATELEAALGSVADGGTIKLLNAINYTQGIAIDGKSFCLDLGSYTLNVNSTGIGIDIKNAVLTVSGDGKLNVTGTKGVRAHNSKISVYSATGTAGAGVEASCSSYAGGAPCEVTVTNLAQGTTAGVYAMNDDCKIIAGSAKATAINGKAIHAEVGGTVEISENADAPNGYGVYCVNGNATIGGHVTGKSTAVYLYEKGSIVINGNINADNGNGTAVEIDGNGNPSNGTVSIEGTILASDTSYVRFVNGVRAKSEGVLNGAYLKYTDSIDGEKAGIVRIKKENAVCTIGTQEFTTLTKALAAANSGDTITFLQTITHTTQIQVEGITVNLDLGNHDLLLDTSANEAFGPALMVRDGGKVKLVGTGTGEFHVKGRSGISAIGVNTEATVHTVEAEDGSGVYMYGSGDFLESNSTVTVLGSAAAGKNSITVGNGTGVSMNAKNGKVFVKGNIASGRDGVFIASNPGTQVTVNGNVTVTSDSPTANLVGIRAYGATTVTVTGDISVQGSECLGVHASASTIKVGGNVASSGMGARSDTKGTVEITGSLSAGIPFIVVGTTEMAADQGAETGEGSLLYTDGANTVQIGSVGVPAPTYSVTVQNDGHGTTSASPSSAEAGTEITLTATPSSGYVFKAWQIVSGGVSIANHKFIMPAANVTVKAIFEPIPTVAYAVTVNGSYAGTTGTGSYAQGSAVTIHAGSRSNYSFTGWTSPDGVTFANAGNATTTFTMPAKNVSVTANWSYDGGGGSGGGSTSEPPKPAIPTEKQPNMPMIAKPNVIGTVKDGVLSATITEQMVKDAIKAAQDAAKKSGKELDGIALDFNVTGTGSYTNLNATIDAKAIDRLKEAGVKFVRIGSAVLDVTLDMGAISEVDKQSTGTVMVSAKKLTKLSDAAKKLIGSRPVFEITVSYQKNGKTEHVSSFGKGTVTLGITYSAASNEKTGSLFGVYVDQNGKPELLTNSSYDNGRVIFSRNTLSTYGVGYKAPSPAFTDTAKHWAKDNIDFVASRDLISGTSATTFAPNTAITRADFLMALGRLSGADVSGYKTGSFTDVKNTDPAMPYIEWAVKNKIVSGYGNGKFGPSDSITREQMAVMMVGYAKATGYKLPASIAAVTFSDSAKISAYAKDAVKAIQQASIMQGKGSNIFDPQGSATRGEAATILRRFVELVIDEGTARGWNQNDAGQWQYIGDNGKAVTGWFTEENARYYFTSDGIMVSGKWLEIGGKWYYFNADGSLAKNTKVDGYEVDENGVRKTK